MIRTMPNVAKNVTTNLNSKAKLDLINVEKKQSLIVKTSF